MLQRLQFSSRHDSSKSIERPLSAALIDALDTFAGAETRYIGDTDTAAAAAADAPCIHYAPFGRRRANVTYKTYRGNVPLL